MLAYRISISKISNDHLYNDDVFISSIGRGYRQTDMEDYWWEEYDYDDCCSCCSGIDYEKENGYCVPSSVEHRRERLLNDILDLSNRNRLENYWPLNTHI